MSATKPLIVYINGYPGVGKLSVARALWYDCRFSARTSGSYHPSSSLLPKAKLFDNHSLIDATAMIFDREMPEYRPLRQQMVRGDTLSRDGFFVTDTLVAAIGSLRYRGEHVHEGRHMDLYRLAVVERDRRPGGQGLFGRGKRAWLAVRVGHSPVRA